MTTSYSIHVALFQQQEPFYSNYPHLIKIFLGFWMKTVIPNTESVINSPVAHAFYRPAKELYEAPGGPT